MQWYAVRTIYEHSRSGQQGTFEERIVAFRASDVAAVHVMALEESKRYLALNPTFRRSENIGIYVLGHNDPSLEGREIWSHLLVAPEGLEEFVQHRYEEPLRDV
jgi:hypothetical protein